MSKINYQPAAVAATKFTADSAILILAAVPQNIRKDEFHESSLSWENGDSWNSSFRAQGGYQKSISRTAPRTENNLRGGRAAPSVEPEPGMKEKNWIGRTVLLVACLWAMAPTGARAQLVLNAAITPAVSTNLVGSDVTLTFTQSLPDVGFSYQWSTNGVSLIDGGQISGSLTPSLTITDVQFTNTGTYSVSLTYTGVVQATASATVYVVDAPVIQSLVPLTTGANVSFTVTATGGLLAYQWTWQGQPIPGATTSTLTFSDAYAQASAGYYSVDITNPVGSVTWDGQGLLFTKPTPSGTYQGLFYDTNIVAVESSGFFQYTLSASKRSYSGKITLGVNSYPFSGVFSLAHDSQVVVPRHNSTPLTMQLQLVTTNDSPQVFGVLTDGTWVAAMSGKRLYFSSQIPTPLATNYTLSLLNTNIEPQVPNGSGYGVVKIQKNGAVSISGQAADGTSISQGSGLSRSGDWPLYVSMFKGRGVLIGWLRVFHQANSSIQGNSVFWAKNPGPDKSYTNGFPALTLQASGSTYVRPLTGSVLAFTNAVASFYAGDLFLDNAAVWDFVKVLVPKPNSFVAEESTDHVSLSVNSGTGVISGQFIDFITGLKTPVKGVVLQQQNAVPGYFTSTNTAGSFTLTKGTTVQ